MNKTQLQEKLLQETKYSKWYLDIIENANSENRAKLNKLNEEYIYYENHHILPKSLFKEYKNLKENKWNSVLLTAKEHFIVHLCIWKHYKSLKYTYGEIKMSKSFLILSSDGKHTSKEYTYFKLNFSHTKETKNKMQGRVHSEETRNKISIGNKGKHCSEETKKKMSIAKQNMSEETKKKISEGRKGIKFSDEHRKNLSKSLKGLKRNPHSEETKNKISKGNKGHIVTQETRKKISESNKRNYSQKSLDINRLLSKCPHCGKEGKGNSMQRWHFDKCKLITKERVDETL